MAAPRIDRRLAAIMAVDIVGYSRLIGADEAGTLARVKAHRVELVEPLIADYRGRVVKRTGDGALVEFGSAVDAVECAVAIQNGMVEREAAEPETRRIRYRIGINIGDIVLEDDDIFGDGVNVAARLEGLAEPGGICVARNVYNQVKAKLDLAFKPMGEHRVKNIAEPIIVYRVLRGPGARTQTRPAAIVWALRGYRPAVIAAAVVVVLVAGGAGAWYVFWRPDMTTPATVAEIAGSGAIQARPALPLPDKPSIVVLPFTNLSGDPKQEYFADAVTEDIITGLARFRELFVISSNSSFRYKGQAVDIKQVGRELGVRFVLEGSVRRSDDRLRVTTQLIDAMTDQHLWAETYDRKLTAASVFEVQDDITHQVIAELGSGMLYASVADSAQRKKTDSLKAYELYHMGTHLLDVEYTEVSNRKTQEYFRDAIERDPNFALAYTGLGWCEMRSYWGGWCPDPQECLNRALEYGLKALALDENQAEIHYLLGDVYASLGQLDRGVAEHAKARALNPHDSDIKSESAAYLAYAGRVDEAIQLTTEAMRLNPFYPDFYLWNVAIVHYPAHKYDTVIDAVERMQEPPVDPLLFLAASYAQVGRLTEARATVKRVLALDPNATVAKFAAQQPYKKPEDLEHYRDGLRKAGLPEGGLTN
jgi:adenylate cyclase